MPAHRGVLARSPVTWWALRVGTAAALGIDAAVHLRNAAAYDDVKATFTQEGCSASKPGWRSPSGCSS